MDKIFQLQYGEDKTRRADEINMALDQFKKKYKDDCKDCDPMGYYYLINYDIGFIKIEDNAETELPPHVFKALKGLIQSFAK